MRVSISNIAWDPSDDADVAGLLKARAIDAIDVAPSKYFKDIEGADAPEIAAVRRWWADRGVEIVGMQSLLFGTQGLNLFGDREVQGAMLDRLDAVCRIGDGLGARKLVFGSPKNRDRSGLTDLQTIEIAVDFFRKLGRRAQAHEVIVCLEPNPVRYGANFMTSARETAHIVQAVDHPAIQMQLDTGAMTINGEDPADIIVPFAPLIGHIHASEPDLVTLGEGATPHDAIAELLRDHLASHTVTIEMLPSRKAVLEAVGSALDTALHFYGAAR